MIRTKSLFVVPVMVAWLSMAPASASAEWIAEFLIGPAFTQDDGPTEFDNSFSVGGRLGHYFEDWPYFGLALDVSYYSPDADLEIPGLADLDFDIGVTGISFDAMLRYPLDVSNEYPRGRFQPYATFGPGIYIANIDTSGTIFGIPVSDDDTETELGVKVGVGLTYLVTPTVGIVGEYRFSHFSPEDVDIDTHRIIFGVSVRF